jgi:Fe-S-cluster containining protein
MSRDCSCQSCVNACQHKPGWFAPGEAEKAAELLGMDFQTFFDTKLVADYWLEHENDLEGALTEDVFCLSPAWIGSDPGEEAPFNLKGVCVFLTDGKCSIHDAKPRECRSYLHDQPEDESDFCKHGIVLEWATKQNQITELLGRKPVPSDGYSFFDSLFGF